MATPVEIVNEGGHRLCSLKGRLEKRATEKLLRYGTRTGTISAEGPQALLDDHQDTRYSSQNAHIPVASAPTVHVTTRHVYLKH